jgi:hypothetical protein
LTEDILRELLRQVETLKEMLMKMDEDTVE